LSLLLKYLLKSENQYFAIGVHPPQNAEEPCDAPSKMGAERDEHRTCEKWIMKDMRSM
jgi:hypothetical protein